MPPRPFFPKRKRSMTTPAMNFAGNPLKGTTTIPTGATVLIPWHQLEMALRRAGDVRPAEKVACFAVADDGVWLILERNG